MGVNDGTVLSATKILDNGEDSDQFNIVLVAEGYQNHEQNAFDSACEDFVKIIQTLPWFDALIKAINIHKINVKSDESEADDPAACTGGTGTTKRTYFDASYCSVPGMRRALGINQAIARSVLNENIPEWHVAIFLVNSNIHGGLGGQIATTGMTSNWINTALHELGHSAFALADEYDSWLGCGIDTNNDVAPPGEPVNPNVTCTTTLSTLKWKNLVDPTTPIPTMKNPDITQCDRRPNVMNDDTIIGLYEGAKYYHSGRFRPAYNCRMRNSKHHFCRVCIQAIQNVLRPFFGTIPALAAEKSIIEFGKVNRGKTYTKKFEISNVGTVNVTNLSLSVNTNNYSASLVGSSNDLIPGESRHVKVRLGPVNKLSTQNSVLQIKSNAPTLEIKLCYSLQRIGWWL